MAYELKTADYIVFCLTIATSLGIGIFYAFFRRGQNTTAEYLLGNRKLKSGPVLLSLVITFESALTIIGYPAEVYIYGLSYPVWMSVGCALAMVVGSMMAVPIFHPLKITSVYEYLELRYKCRAPRLLATVMGMIYFIIYMGLNIYGPALALSSVINFPTWASIIVVTVVAVIYTSIGGIKAVVWTDVLQFTIMTAGIIAITVKIFIDAGGIGRVMDINNRYRRTFFLNFDTDPTERHTFWSLCVGGIFRYQSIVYNQATVQRIVSVKSQKEARMILLMTGPIFAVVTMLISFASLGFFAYFNVLRCDPLKSGQIQKANQIAPFSVLACGKDIPGMTGLFIATLLSASLSTISSGLSGASAQFVEDFIKPYCTKISERKATFISKLSVIFFGLCALSIAFLSSNLTGSLTQIAGSLYTCFSGTLGGLFVYSILCPWASTKGAITGSLTAVIFVFWMSIGQNCTPDLPKEPWLPSNPVDQCLNFNTSIAQNTSFTFSNDTMLQLYDDELKSYWSKMDNYKKEKKVVPGIQKLYTVTYALFGTIGFFVTIFTASIVSLLTGYPKPHEVDPRHILSIAEVFVPFLPQKIKRRLEFGIDFKKRKEWLKHIDFEVTNEVEIESLQKENGTQKETTAL